MPLEVIYGGLMGALRALGLVAILPTPVGAPMPRAVRVALAVLLAAVLAGTAPVAAVPTAWGGLLSAAVHEALLGLAMGFIGRTVFAAAELAGRLIASEVGLVASPGFDAPRPDQEPLPTFISAFAGLMFFLLGAHESVLAAFARSFELAPAGAAAFSPGAAETAVQATARLVELGVRIAAPFIALNFVVTLGFAILGRAVPKMNVFVASMAVRALAGLTLFAGAGTLIARYLSGAFDDLPWRMLELVGRG
ncbi:MAG TPA: flagellar biosynthetic protein FliR [Candidatus Synoicihabitans sp.]|nr:flagellar biosynthetic protein FliR [Candidatus Synoicihabitans sp.]